MARGSVKARPLKDGTMRYRVKWETRAPDGTRRHFSETIANKKDADAFLAKKLGEIHDGTFVAPSKETLKAFLDRWLVASAPGWSEATRTQYGSIVRNRIDPKIGSVLLSRLDALTIQTFYAELIAAGYAPNSVVAVHAVLDSALTRAVAWRLIVYNPTDAVDVPAALQPAPKSWSAAEAATFLSKTAKHHHAALWRLGLDSGMRLGEMLALAWRDVDLDRGVVSVRRTLTRTAKNSWKIGEHAKTGRSRRAIDLGPSTVAALRTQHVRQAERRLALGGAWLDLELVFDRGTGDWIHPSVVYRSFCRAVKRATLPALTPHGMRHTMATLMLEAGVHPKVVQERLGHTSIQMTLDRYSHVSRTMQREAADTMERVLRGQARPRRGHETG